MGIFSGNDIDNTGDSEVTLKAPDGTDLLGQKTSAGSLPVVIASNQSTIPISAASLPLPTGASTAALQTQPGVDIGDVTVNNGSGAAAVSVQDGGNSLTVDGTVTANQGSSPWVENISQFGGSAIVTGTGNGGAGIPRVTVSNDSSTKINNGTNTLAIYSDGSIKSNTEPNKPITYSAAFAGISLVATPTDIFTIRGSATKTIRITRISVTTSTTAGSGIVSNLSLIKRSTADSGGTSSVGTNVPHDSTNPAGTATIRAYTANPTLGTAIGNLRAYRMDTTSAGSLGSEIVWEFGTRPSQAPVLRGTSEQVCINFGSTTITGGIADFSIEWTEE